MGARFVPAHIGIIETQGDEQPVLDTGALSYLLIGSPGEPFVMHSIGVVPSLAQQIDMCA